MYTPTHSSSHVVVVVDVRSNEFIVWLFSCRFSDSLSCYHKLAFAKTELVCHVKAPLGSAIHCK